MRRMIRIVDACGLLAAFVLMAYCGVLMLRIATGGTGRVGSDVIAIAYALLGVVVVSNLLLMVLARRTPAATRLPYGAVLGLLALSLWLGLHLSGLIFSHGSLFSR